MMLRNGPNGKNVMAVAIEQSVDTGRDFHLGMHTPRL
jgi:hypothetical protein